MARNITRQPLVVLTTLLFIILAVLCPQAAPIGVGLIGLGGAIQATTALMEGKSANSAIKNVNTNLKQGTDGARLLQKTY